MGMMMIVSNRYGLPISRLIVAVHIQTARFSEIAQHRKGSVTRCDQLWIVLHDYCVGEHFAVLFRMALIEWESHCERSGTFVVFRFDEARLGLIVEIASGVHDASEIFIRFQFHQHRIRATFQMNILNALRRWIDLKQIANVLLPNLCRRIKSKMYSKCAARRCAGHLVSHLF